MILYIAYTGFEPSKVSGIWTKIIGQARAFERSLDTTYCTALISQMAYLMHNNEVIEKTAAVTRKDYLKILTGWIEKYQVKRTYVRYPFADKWFIELLKYQKENKIRTVLEIPTYPYNDQMAYGRIKVEDAYYNQMVGDYVDIITTYSYDHTIWGKPCINLVNGIDAETYEIKRKNHYENKLVLIAVSSSMAFWNGFERILEGMRQYVQNKGTYDVSLLIVGEGADENYYRKLVLDYGLKSQVEFCGFLEGKALDDVYSRSDVAVNSLGAYKMNVTFGASLKGAEYCARGIPMVCGYTDMRFPREWPYILNVSNDDTAIDINAVISFYENITVQDGYEEQIHNYAVEHLSWDSIMQPVIDYLR